MARDAGKRGGRKGGGASRGGARKPAPGWLWLVTGLTVGLFVAFLVFLSQHQGAPADGSAAKQSKPVKAEKTPPPEPKNTTVNKAPETKTPEKKPMNYDFYTRLPEFEVEVPEDKGSTRPRPLANPGNYVVQAGSFKAAKEAEARKAELALLGIRSTVQNVTVDGKATYHRVRIGPYRDLDRLNQVRQTLRENHIDFVTLRERS